MVHHSIHADVGFLVLGLLGALALYAHTLNPFSRFNRVKNPFRTSVSGGEISLVQRFTPEVRTLVLWKLFAYYKCAWHIVSNLRGGAKTRSKTLDAIIADIHRLRFNPQRPYLISGDHFNVLYPRNLGVFYHSTLDAHTAHNETDWENRQRVYLQTVAYALEAFKVRGDCATTIVPVGPKAVCCIDIYRYPSDSLYGILYGLSVLRGAPSAYAKYFSTDAPFKLRTTLAAELLLEKNRSSIKRLLENYHAHVYDAAQGLIRRDIALSSAKDSVLRESFVL
jgi:hypothetical protein